MVELSMLVMPILLSSVIVFIASSIIHMAPLWHKNDFPKLKEEEKVMDALRPLAIPPGEYMVPRPASGKEMRSPEHTEKLKKGPVLLLSVWPNGPAPMSKNLILWFLYSVVISIFAGYIAGRALPVGANYLQVFRFAGATAFYSYAAGLWQNSIWFGRPWKATAIVTLDGLIYALLTAGTFGWLWPR